MLRQRSIRRLTLTAISAFMVLSVLTAVPAQAAVPSLDKIRVALFMQLPGKYEATVPAATFSSEGGMNIGILQSDGVHHSMAVPANTQARFAIDDFKVMLFESANFTNAWAVYEHVKMARGQVSVTSVLKNGSIVYQVAEGAYKSATEATAAVGRWTADASLKGLMGSFKPVVQGPYRLESSAYPDQSAAAKATAAFGAAGLDSFAAATLQADGTVSYSVMVGAAASAQELEAVRIAAAKVAGGASLKEVDANSNYFILKDDYSISGQTSGSAVLHLFPGNDMKVWISPTAAEPIQLTERSGRIYRGDFELSTFNGKLAVINELPFEEYLYSVVAIEMYASWPLEALKAQAVAARSYALNKGLGFQIAHVVDTTLSQAYYGKGAEQQSATEAVEATRGEVALHNGKVIEALFSSNGGGMSADAAEVWNNAVPYLQSVASPDSSAEDNLLSWYRVELPSGLIGYIREDLVKDTGQKTAAGSPIMELTTDATNVRRHPIIQDSVPAVARLDSGTRVIALEKTMESNPMNWVRGPFTGQEMASAINARVSTKLTHAITSMEVSKRGPSGRALEVLVNGQKLEVSTPDSLRSALGVQGSLPSTLFEIEETGKVVIQGAGGHQRTKTSEAESIYVMGSSGQSIAAANEYMFIMDGDEHMRTATKEPGFRFVGKGNGHGAGLSQYGALSLAQQGYDYQYILKYYYKDVTIAKE